LTQPGERLAAALADRYRIERELGQGGMATVYLAQDLKHDRKVAIKVLRPELAAVIGADRFLHEIKTTANLQHPHILPLHDSGTVEGTVFYVMPYVEGESLRDRLNREKQLPVEDAVRIAREVGSALDYAHRHGIIHRDIKPENILLHDGTALVADFGIALAASTTGGTRMTETGMSLGTPHYMSPEQAMGERVLDARSDVYALGAVLYEMLAGEPPFSGPTAQAIVAKVMTSEPTPLHQLRKTVPGNIEAVVLTALQKLPADRFATAAELVTALGNPTFATTTTQGAMAPVTRRRGPALPVMSAVAVLAVAAAVWQWKKPQPTPMTTRFEILVPDSISGRAAPAVTPDGSRIILAMKGRLWVRSVGALELAPIPGAEGARFPFVSPDGLQVGFIQRGSIRVVPLAGGPPRTIADTAAQASWGSDGNIYYTSSGVLRRIPAAGGPVERLYAAGPGVSIECAELLPGGKAVLFSEGRDLASGQIRALDLKSKALTNLERGWCARYASSGHLVIAREGFLLAAPFDAGRLQVKAAAVPLVEGVDETPFALGGGTLSYPQTQSTSELPVVVDRQGRMRELTNLPPNLRFSFPRISPDGRRIGFRVFDPAGNTNVWIYSMPGGPLTRLTFSGTDVDDPNWTPDGVRVSFGARLKGDRSLFLQRADGGSEPEVLLRSKASLWTSQWLPDGKRFVFSQGDDVIALGMGWLGHPDSSTMLLASAFSQRHPTLSPDGKYLAYDSNESGRTEVYIRVVEGPGRWQVSTEGGYEPRWSRRGGEIFFKNSDSLYAAAIDTRQGVVIRGTTSLFSIRYLPPYWYDVFPGDTTFMMVRSNESLQGHPPVVILNFLQELERRVPR
jgi:eukaryotic-like serine/threonine-protein kinase